MLFKINLNFIHEFTNGLYIKGQVLKKGINIPCRVDLYYRNTKKLAKTVTTDNQGYYQFDDIELGRYFIVAHDPDGEYNAVIQDNIIPK